MKDSNKKGIIGTALLHAVILLILFLVAISKPLIQEEGGVPVMLGNMEEASGNADPFMLTDVEITDQPLAEAMTEEAVPLPTPEIEVEETVITQNEEPSIEVKKNDKPKEQPKKEIKKETPKPVVTPVKTETKKETPKPKEKTEAELKAEAERKAAAEKAAAEKAAAQAAAQRVAGAFGKGTLMGSTGQADSSTGNQGTPTGNAATGKTQGVGGYGSYDLGGRSIGEGGLPIPSYTVQDEGRVVVTIVVNPAGQVISTSINKKTNTVNAALRKAAEDAAKKARFVSINGAENVTGTITYNFKLK